MIDAPKDPLYMFRTPRGECPTHGTVAIFTIRGHNSDGTEFDKIDLCPACCFDWIKANVTQVEATP